MAIKVLTMGIGRKKVAVLIRREAEVAVDGATPELEIKHFLLLRVTDGS
jgi:hypothetical protein